MPVFTDQTGKTITLHHPPGKIISLVPSQTELLADLGLEKEVVGITKFCVHPESWFRNKTRIGGTRQINTGLIHELKPDLILANKEENVKEQVEALAKEFPVWTSNVRDLPSALDMIEQVGILAGREPKANDIVARISDQFSRLQTPDCELPTPASRLPTPASRLRTIYLIWKDPYMTAGGDTFIHAMLEAAGFENMYAGQNRYPEITLEQLKKDKPELLLLSSEPFPFKQKHIDMLQPGFPDTRIMPADGEMFSWYGSRLLHAPAYFHELRRQVVNTM